MLKAKFWRMAIAVAVSVVLAGGVALALPGESSEEVVTEKPFDFVQALQDKEKAIEIVETQLSSSRYGGLYVGENGEAHVMLTNEDDAVLFDGLEVVLHFCRYTRAELETIHWQVEKQWPKELKLGGTWIVTKENVLGVGMRVTREEGEQWLKDHPEADMSWAEELPLKLYYLGDPGNFGIMEFSDVSLD